MSATDDAGSAGEQPGGLTFGPFRITGFRAAGGMGSVYDAIGPENESVVVKTIRQELASDPSYRKRFCREVQVAQHFRSNYIAQVLAFDVDAKTPWVALEKVDGRTLPEVLADDGPLPESRLVSFAADLADAVHSFFDAGLVHGDLNPKNVVLQDNGRLKILDLGLARPTADEAPTDSGPPLGAPYWLAPEVGDGQRPGSGSDVHQWGKLVLYMGTGFPGGAPKTQQEALGHLPGRLRALVEQSMNTKGKARPTPEKLWLETRSAAMRDGGRVPHVSRATGKRLAYIAGAFAAALVGAGLLGAFDGRDPDETRPETGTAPVTETSGTPGFAITSPVQPDIMSPVEVTGTAGVLAAGNELWLFLYAPGGLNYVRGDIPLTIDGTGRWRSSVYVGRSTGENVGLSYEIRLVVASGDGPERIRERLRADPNNATFPTPLPGAFEVKATAPVTLRGCARPDCA